MSGAVTTSHGAHISPVTSAISDLFSERPAKTPQPDANQRETARHKECNGPC
jgi:hypothetical protein